MSAEPKNPLINTMESIFANTNQAIKSSIQSSPKLKKAPKKDLELALAVLLVDLASCDQNFDPHEYHLISNGMRRMFGTTKDQVQALVNQANLVLKNLRGTARFGELLKNHLSEAERMAIMEIIDDIISSDKKEDGFEVYLRHKIADLLQVKIAERKEITPDC